MVDYISWCFLACFKVMARQAFWSILSFTVASYLVTWQSVKGTDALNMITSPAKVQRVKQLEKAHCPPTVLLLSMHQTPITFPCLLVLSPDLTPAEGLLVALEAKYLLSRYILACCCGFYVRFSIFFLACECNPSGSYGNVCDPYNGQCPCRYGARGRQCNKCPAGYYNFPYCQCK